MCRRTRPRTAEWLAAGAACPGSATAWRRSGACTCVRPGAWPRTTGRRRGSVARRRPVSAAARSRSWPPVAEAPALVVRQVRPVRRRPQRGRWPCPRSSWPRPRAGVAGHSVVASGQGVRIGWPLTSGRGHDRFGHQSSRSQRCARQRRDGDPCQVAMACVGHTQWPASRRDVCASGSVHFGLLSPPCWTRSASHRVRPPAHGTALRAGGTQCQRCKRRSARDDQGRSRARRAAAAMGVSESSRWSWEAARAGRIGRLGRTVGRRLWRAIVCGISRGTVLRLRSAMRMLRAPPKPRK